jgi:hypothetical protein
MSPRFSAIGSGFGSNVHVMLATRFRVMVDSNRSPREDRPREGSQHQAMLIQDVCPRCKSPKYKKNGHIHNGKQNHQ